MYVKIKDNVQNIQYLVKSFLRKITENADIKYKLPKRMRNKVLSVQEIPGLNILEENLRNCLHGLYTGGKEQLSIEQDHIRIKIPNFVSDDVLNVFKTHMEKMHNLEIVLSEFWRRKICKTAENIVYPRLLKEQEISLSFSLSEEGEKIAVFHIISETEDEYEDK